MSGFRFSLVAFKSYSTYFFKSKAFWERHENPVGSLQEFVEGLLKLKGPARAIDMAVLHRALEMGMGMGWLWMALDGPGKGVFVSLFA